MYDDSSISEKRNKTKHSVSVPTQYREAARVLSLVEEGRASLKNSVFNARFRRQIGALHALVSNVYQHRGVLGQLLDKAKLTENKHIRPALAKVLVTELLWGKQKLIGESKPVQTVLSCKDALLKHLKKLESSGVDSVTAEFTVPRYVRVNTLKTSLEDAVQCFTKEGWELLPSGDTYENFLETVQGMNESQFLYDHLVPNVLVFPSGTSFFNHPAYRQTSVLLQDKASCLAPMLLNPSPGSHVIDACAAPGMKTTQLAAIMENKGVIHAIERDETRVDTLHAFVRDAGIDIVQVKRTDFTSLPPSEYRDVRYILVDPSCSGTGMVSRLTADGKPEKIDETRLQKLASFQVMILRHALRFPRVRRVVYSTCSVEEAENEAVVADVLRTHGDSFRVAHALPQLPVENRGLPGYEFSSCCVRMSPVRDNCNGFFLAVIERIKSKNKVGRSEECQTVFEDDKRKVLGEDYMSHKKRKVEDVSETSKPIGVADCVTESVTKGKKRKKKDKNLYNEDEFAVEASLSMGMEVGSREKKVGKKERAEVKELGDTADGCSKRVKTQNENMKEEKAKLREHSDIKSIIHIKTEKQTEETKSSKRELAKTSQHEIKTHKSERKRRKKVCAAEIPTEGQERVVTDSNGNVSAGPNGKYVTDFYVCDSKKTKDREEVVTKSTDDILTARVEELPCKTAKETKTKGKRANADENDIEVLEEDVSIIAEIGNKEWKIKRNGNDEVEVVDGNVCFSRSRRKSKTKEDVCVHEVSDGESCSVEEGAPLVKEVDTKTLKSKKKRKKEKRGSHTDLHGEESQQVKYKEICENNEALTATKDKKKKKKKKKHHKDRRER